jgi:hypothetical protein
MFHVGEARWDASGELATFRTEFLPPNGLGTVAENARTEAAEALMMI